MPICITNEDITKMKVDAIVNAANTRLQIGGGVCGAVYKAAGINELQAACDELSPIEKGEAVITSGFKLPAKYIIHTSGPVYKNGNLCEESLLRLCYKNSLDIAWDNGCRSIAFPLISSGVYGYPKKEALSIAINTINNWLQKNDNIIVWITLFDKETFNLAKIIFHMYIVEEI